VFALIDRPEVTALVADKYKKMPFFRWFINRVGGIWLNRDEADVQALRAARDHLKSGGVLGIAPEGTRSRTGALIPAKTGVAYLAEKAGVPIFPAAIYGTEDAMYKILRFHRPKIYVQFGEPFIVTPFHRGERSAALQKYTDEIMARIAAMLPPDYRGVYAGHSRLQELLAENAQDGSSPVVFKSPW
jgi:1-acyl-sn-glycerol-3-phosphate acyltransferase